MKVQTQGNRSPYLCGNRPHPIMQPVGSSCKSVASGATSICLRPRANSRTLPAGNVHPARHALSTLSAGSARPAKHASATRQLFVLRPECLRSMGSLSMLNLQKSVREGASANQRVQLPKMTQHEHVCQQPERLPPSKELGF